MSDKRLEKLKNMAQRFHDSGTVDKVTMREIDAVVLKANLDDMSAEKIKSIRDKNHISQSVLAAYLNMSPISVQKWERGETKPTGAALKLLNIIDKQGLEVVQ